MNNVVVIGDNINKNVAITSDNVDNNVATILVAQDVAHIEKEIISIVGGYNVVITDVA